MTAFDEAYVRELLEAARPQMSRSEFQAFCRPDINAGYAAEVKEAKRRYFASAETGGKPE